MITPEAVNEQKDHSLDDEIEEFRGNNDAKFTTQQA